MNILPHVRFQCLFRPSFPTCTVPVKIFELSVPLLPHVQFQPNMHYPFLAHVRSKLQLIKNQWPKNILKTWTKLYIRFRDSVAESCEIEVVVFSLSLFHWLFAKRAKPQKVVKLDMILPLHGRGNTYQISLILTFCFSSVQEWKQPFECDICGFIFLLRSNLNKMSLKENEVIKQLLVELELYMWQNRVMHIGWNCTCRKTP